MISRFLARMRSRARMAMSARTSSGAPLQIDVQPFTPRAAASAASSRVAIQPTRTPPRPQAFDITSRLIARS